MKTAVKLCIILVTIFALSSCVFDVLNGIKGNGNVMVVNRDVNDNFTKIKASRGIDVYITKGSKASVRVEADENLHNIITTEVKGKTLVISSEKNINRASAKKVYVMFTTLNEIEASSAADVYSENTLMADSFTVSASSAADVKINIHAKSITANASSGSDITIKGTTDTYTAKANSGSSIKSYQLESKNAIVKVNSGADIKVYATESLDAKANSGGDVDYKGNPKKLVKKSSSGGSVSNK